MAWPKKPPDKHLTWLLGVPMTKASKQDIESVSKALGMSKTEWARQTLLDALYPQEQPRS